MQQNGAGIYTGSFTGGTLIEGNMNIEGGPALVKATSTQFRAYGGSGRAMYNYVYRIYIY